MSEPDVEDLHTTPDMAALAKQLEQYEKELVQCNQQLATWSQFFVAETGKK
jgi:hypothetical protein